MKKYYFLAALILASLSLLYYCLDWGVAMLVVLLLVWTLILVLFIRRYIIALPGYIRFLVIDLFSNPLSINATVYFRYGKMYHANWGDDMNYLFLKELLQRKISIYDNSLLAKNKLFNFGNPNYLVIGSTISMLTNENTIVWGAGVIDGDALLPCKPQKVLAVRGPLTRRYLLNNGVKCPEVYGDPILLVKKIYNPTIPQKYRIGVIPHYLDFYDPKFEELKRRDDVLFISMEKYNNWHDIVDQVLSCENIASSSLHGLILAETYNVPNVWIQVSDKVKGGNFKFNDFFESIGKFDMLPVVYTSVIEYNDILEKFSTYTQGNIDLQPLIDSAPWKFHFNDLICNNGKEKNTLHYS